MGALLIDKKGQKKGPIIIAAKNGHIHIVSLLIRHGVHPDWCDSSGNTSIHYAAAFGWLNVVEYLIDHGADPNIKNGWNTTPLMLSMLKNHFRIMEHLLGLKKVDKEMIDE